MEASHPEIYKKMIKMILLAALLYVGYCLLLFLFQRHILFPRYMIPASAGMDEQALPMETIWLETSFGKVEAWFMPPEAKPDNRPSPVVIFAHGNAEVIDFNVQELHPFTRWGIGVLLVEFPGYGRSKGKPSQKSITETFISAYDLVTARDDVDASKVILYGRSIGAGAVCTLLNYRPAAGLILMSAFTSVRAFALRYLAPGFLVRDPFDNLSAIQAYKGPKLIMHGRHDEVIPYSHGEALYKASHNAQFVSYECGHNDCPPDGNQFWRDIKSFVDSVLES